MMEESYEARWRQMLRSLEQRSEREGLRELALFAGAGGGILGGHLLGWRTVCAVELDPFCRSALLARQRDGHLPRFAIWDNVVTFDGVPWRGHVDVVSGGFPCQDISSAGSRAGITGARSGLWAHFARIVREVRPSFVLVENSPDLTSRGLDVVLGNLAALGYDAEWDVLGARHVGAPHKRDRIWILASDAHRSGQRVQPEHAEVGGAPAPAAADGDADGERIGRPQHEQAEFARNSRHVADADREGGWRQQGRRRQAPIGERAPHAGSADWWSVARFAGVGDGVAHRVDRVRATGNGQVPAVVRLAWETLMEAAGC